MTGSPPRLRLIGYWMEGITDEGLFPPQEFVRDQDPKLRQKIADYLDRGEVRTGYRGLSYCRFCNIDNGSYELTDGYWTWPEGLSHYIRKHGVVLPEEFNEHVLSGVPPLAPTPEWETEGPDLTFWKAWGARNVSARHLDHIAKVRAEAAEKAERRLAAAVAECETSKGLSDKKCQWRDCNNRAMMGKPICCRCSISKRVSS